MGGRDNLSLKSSKIGARTSVFLSPLNRFETHSQVDQIENFHLLLNRESDANFRTTCRNVRQLILQAGQHPTVDHIRRDLLVK